jgi:hypothetical protein
MSSVSRQAILTLFSGILVLENAQLIWLSGDIRKTVKTKHLLYQELQYYIAGMARLDTFEARA